MHQSRPVLPLERSGEPAHRLHDTYAYYANNLAPATQISSEIIADRRFPAWSFVSLCNPVLSTPTVQPHSLADWNSKQCLRSIHRASNNLQPNHPHRFHIHDRQLFDVEYN